MKVAFAGVFLFFSFIINGQTPMVEMLTSGTATSLRGLSVVNDNVAWVSGSNGTVGKTTNGGKTWKWITVKGFEKNDFRDIEAFDAATAIIMSVAEPAYILKTNDGGDSWKVVYENKNKGMFLDAMEFWNEQAGIVIGGRSEEQYLGRKRGPSVSVAQHLRRNPCGSRPEKARLFGRSYQADPRRMRFLYCDTPACLETPAPPAAALSSAFDEV